MKYQIELDVTTHARNSEPTSTPTDEQIVKWLKGYFGVVLQDGRPSLYWKDHLTGDHTATAELIEIKKIED